MVRQKITGYFPFNIEYQKEMRKQAIAFLGSKCANPKCLVPGGCLDMRCLQIDHIHGITEDEPRLVGALLYEDILDNPKSREKYQLLCANCNWIKRSENNENRGYIQQASQTKPLFPTAHIDGCINNDVDCGACHISKCSFRYKGKK